MKKFTTVLVILLLITSVTSLFATTHLIYWVNGSQSNTITQGDFLAWEMDVTTPGSTVSIDLYLDLDGSHSISEGDLLLETFQMQDGGTDNDGPADSSATPDGIIYVNFGPFGFAPQNYVMHVTDTDNSEVTNWFTMIEMDTPPATISGTVTIESVDAPDPLYENIMIGAQGEGLFSGLTDENGNYTINLPVADADWYVEVFFRNTVPGFIAPNTNYQLNVPAGDTGSINFTYLKPQAWVYGDLRDDEGTLINRNMYIGLENQTNGSSNEGMINNGHFNLPLSVEVQGTDSTNYYWLNIDNSGLIPDYLIPQFNESIPISVGDSLQMNLTAYSTDAVIYGYVTEGGEAPSQAYQFYASSETYGSTGTQSDPATGYFELHVRSGSSYWVNLQDDPSWGTPLPDGYVIEGGNGLTANPGETIYFNMILAGNLLAGNISFDPGDPTNFNYDHNHINAWDVQTNSNYGTRADNSQHFQLPVPDGVYNLNFSAETNNYLVIPSEYQNIGVQQDTVDNLNFFLNYAHANLIIKLINAPIPAWLEWYGIQTAGEYPNVYSTSTQLQPDSTFHFNICEGSWYIAAPFYDDSYDVNRSDTTLVVTEEDSSFYVEFVYYLKSAINKLETIPTKFRLAQNYPNPFNPVTTISYDLPIAGQVDLSVYNILGQKMATLVSEKQVPGTYQAKWDAAGFASGVYLYKLETDKGFSSVKKLVLMK